MPGGSRLRHNGIPQAIQPYPSQESPPIAQRKPPSQRPERQLDDTARAIARLTEDTKAEKAAEARKGDGSSTGTGGNPKIRQAPPAVNGMGQRKIGGAAPYTSSKRPKTGGGV